MQVSSLRLPPIGWGDRRCASSSKGDWQLPELTRSLACPDVKDF